MEAEGSIGLSTPLWETRVQLPERQDAQHTDQRDLDTPDRWIRRHEAMLRLTGRHPFNSEPPLPLLQQVGWITPPALHVVRNHGSVPRLSWENHRLAVTGVPRPCELTMDQLSSGEVGEVVTLPVTFICAGNRRKEQNMTRKTVGFNWGAAAVGNSVWRGVRLCDLLAHVGVTRVSREHRFVCFEGPEGELPQGVTGSYGTSIDMGWALDRERDVLLAFEQNGKRLTPDHGAPLRTLLPGCIGGRMVKWLTRLRVSPEPSDNHYHRFDNRVLPPHVDAERATAEGWWHKEEYVINHMNINSAMFEPRHNSVFCFGSPSAAPTVRLSGYAYAGGGARVIRAEVSLDEGVSWEMADLTRPEDEIAAARGTDKHWCWAWWETEIDAMRLIQCKEIRCRAVDSSQNIQPANLTWNVMGMMNNCHFRVLVHPMRDACGHTAVWFEHPTMPGNQPGGWMTEDAGKFDPSSASEAAPGKRGVAPSRTAAAIWGAGSCLVRLPVAAVTAQAPDAVAPAGKRVTSTTERLQGITSEQVAMRTGEAGRDLWIAVKGRVFDCTPYLQDHPGGPSSLLLAAGQDATEDFEAVHSRKAWDLLEEFYIGPLVSTEETQLCLKAVPTPSAVGVAPADCFLNPRKQQQLTLVEKIPVSHDTRIFRFCLPSPNTRLGLPTGKHLFLRATVGGVPVMRAYTPMTDDTTLGHVDLLVKVYFAGVHPRFPDGGKMSQHLESMQVGDSIHVRGPLGEFLYKGRGAFSHKGDERKCRRICMIAGGTGLTPCYQVAAAVLRDPEDGTQVSLLYANQTPQDILARQALETMAGGHPDRFRVSYTVDRVPAGCEWPHDVGFVSEAMVRQQLFEPAEDTIVLLCGPPAMLEHACLPHLATVGHQSGNIFTF